MQVDISRIKLKKRLRKDLGEIEGLADSMARFGQLHPLVLTKRYVLVSGRRRLEAAKSLGWSTIEAIMLEGRSKAQLLELEIDENVYRSALTRDELEEGLAKLDRLRNPGFFARIWNAIRDFFARLFGRID
ncbi:MAG TPA: chromosome partitioning protein ParB [Spirochaetaceae bacterium]|nr:chromosome partitioning protein ParB [Spirochaetaceae bacterium]